MTASAITPVTLLTGFLGSGKTTLLNRLLKHPAMEETAVLINEFGAVSIDHLLVRESSENIMVMANGCICCSVAGDMVTALRDLYFRRANGQIPDFRRVIIETTGLADPAPIMHTLIDLPLAAARYALSGVVSTVDAQHGERQLDEHFESVKQAAVADRLVITKCDLVSAAQLESLRERLAALNRGARIIESRNGDIEPALVFDTGLYQPGRKVPDVRRWLSDAAYRPVNAFTSAAPVKPHRHDARIASFVLTFDAPVVWLDLVEALETLVDLRGDSLLRLKGIVNATGETTPRAIHAVQHTIYPVARLPQWPDDDHRTRLVFITRDLDEAFVRQLLTSIVQSVPAAA